MRGMLAQEANVPKAVRGGRVCLRGRGLASAAAPATATGTGPTRPQPALCRCPGVAPLGQRGSCQGTMSCLSPVVPDQGRLSLCFPPGDPWSLPPCQPPTPTPAPVGRALGRRSGAAGDSTGVKAPSQRPSLSLAWSLLAQVHSRRQGRTQRRGTSSGPGMALSTRSICTAAPQRIVTIVTVTASLCFRWARWGRLSPT